MNIFRRVLRWFFILGGIIVGLVMTFAALLAQRLIRPLRQQLWGTPADLDMPFEAVTFPAADGVRLSGWFIPAPKEPNRRGATLIMVHGWGWNRLGETASDPVATLTAASPVDLLRLAYSLHKDGFGLLMYDSHNHDEWQRHLYVHEFVPRRLHRATRRIQFHDRQRARWVHEQYRQCADA